MAGHSAWKNIKHKKAANDARRGKLWSKCARAIIVAAKNGGGDPEANLSLRTAIDDARAVNMPRDTIEKAIKKGTGDLQAESYESAIYEGYGPGGVAILLEILTDNRNRTSPEVKALFDKHGGKLGGPGSAAMAFAIKGQLMVAKSLVAEDRLMEIALEGGAEDVRDSGESWQILTEPALLHKVRQALDQAKIACESVEITRVPLSMVMSSGEDARRVLALMEALDDHDDVQKVHANFEISEAELAAIK